MADGVSAAATIVKKSAMALKFLGVALLLYIGVVTIYALSGATGNLLADTFMLVALALPVMAVVRFFIGTPRPRDWADAMVLPLASWPWPNCLPTSIRRPERRSGTARSGPAASCSAVIG